MEAQTALTCLSSVVTFPVAFNVSELLKFSCEVLLEAAKLL